MIPLALSVYLSHCMGEFLLCTFESNLLPLPLYTAPQIATRPTGISSPRFDWPPLPPPAVAGFRIVYFEKKKIMETICATSRANHRLHSDADLIWC